VQFGKHLCIRQHVQQRSSGRESEKPGQGRRKVLRIRSCSGIWQRRQRYGCSEQRLRVRKFVAGEKFWVTGIAAHKDGIVVSTFSDPYNDVRFYGEIKFPFAKGSVPPVDDFVKTVSEVITVQPAEGQGDQGNQGGQGDQGSQPAPEAAPEPAPAPAAMQTIAPPPPSDAPPPTIEIGQSKDQVIAGFGQPARVAKLGAKEIFYYKDMKVTFTNGKVSNVE